MINNATLSDYGKECNSCIIYIVLLAIAFLIIIDISGAFLIFVGITETLIY